MVFSLLCGERKVKNLYMLRKAGLMEPKNEMTEEEDRFNEMNTMNNCEREREKES